MDGFFVAKFKVEKRTKGGKNGAAVDEDGEIVDSKAMVDEDGDAIFNDDADRAIIEGQLRFMRSSRKLTRATESKRKNLLKTKGIKLAPKSGSKATFTTSERSDPAIKMPKGKKVTLQRRSKV